MSNVQVTSIKRKATSREGSGRPTANNGVCVGHPETPLQRCRMMGLLLPCYPPHTHIPSSMLKQSKAKPHQPPPCAPSSVPCLSYLHGINFGSESRILLQRLGRFIPCASLARRSHQHPTNPLKLAQGTKHVKSVTVPQHMSCIHVQAVSSLQLCCSCAGSQWQS